MQPAVVALVGVALLTVGAGGDQTPAWPAQNAPARIAFVRSIDPAIARGAPSLLSRLIRVIAGSGRSPSMNQPHGAAIGPDGRLYVTDAIGGVLHVYGVTKSDYRTIAIDAVSPIGIAFADQRMIVTDSAGGRVIGLDLRGRVQWTVGRREGFVRPTGIVAAAGLLYVVDTLRNSVIAVTPSGVVGQAFGQRGTSQGQLNFPTHITADAAGLLYVTDTLNFRIQVFDSAGRFVRTFGQLGDGPGDFDKPKGIAVDAKGRIYVVEGLNDVVQVYDPEGRLLLVFGGSGAGPGQLWLPAGITVAGSTVYVVDSANRRVQVYERHGDAR